MKEGKLPKRQYTWEFKAEATRLAASIGGHEAARRLGVPVATLGNWSRRGIASAGAGGAAVPGDAFARRPVSELEAENSRLRRELAEAKLDVEILQKATANFARGARCSTPGSTNIVTSTPSVTIACLNSCIPTTEAEAKLLLATRQSGHPRWRPDLNQTASANPGAIQAPGMKTLAEAYALAA